MHILVFSFPVNVSAYFLFVIFTAGMIKNASVLLNSGNLYSGSANFAAFFYSQVYKEKPLKATLKASKKL